MPNLPGIVHGLGSNPLTFAGAVRRLAVRFNNPPDIRQPRLCNPVTVSAPVLPTPPPQSSELLVLPPFPTEQNELFAIEKAQAAVVLGPF